MSYNFDLLIETRSSNDSGVPNYIVKGYATTPNNAYTYDYKRNLKEIFSEEGIRNFTEKAKNKQIFIDALHEIGTLHNTKQLLQQIQMRSGVDISKESEIIIDSIKHSDIPLAKLDSLNMDERGVFVETKLNPLYKEVDDSHRKYFDAIWYSLQNGYLNKFSINYKPTRTHSEIINGEIIPKIDDVDVFGISFTQGAANDMCDITEVAMRSAVDANNEVKRMEEDLKRQNEEMRAEIEALKRKEAERLANEQRLAEEQKQKEIQMQQDGLKRQQEEIQKQKEELERQKRDVESQLSKKSIVPPESQFRSQNKGSNLINDMKELYPEVQTPKSGARINHYGFYNSNTTRPNIDGKIGFGELIHAQAVGKTIQDYPEYQKRLIGRESSDIVFSRNK